MSKQALIVGAGGDIAAAMAAKLADTYEITLVRDARHYRPTPYDMPDDALSGLVAHIPESVLAKWIGRHMLDGHSDPEAIEVAQN